MEEQKRDAKVKLRLDDIKVDSFLTGTESKDTKAGTGVSYIACTYVFGSCRFPCTYRPDCINPPQFEEEGS